MASEWWLDELPDQLEQGDVFLDVPFAVPDSFLGHVNLKGGASGWAETTVAKPVKGTVPYLFRGKNSAAILLNHGCDIDKQNAKFLQFAAVQPLALLPAEQQERVISQQSRAMLYLPDVPGLGDCYADMRITTRVKIDAEKQRAAAMTPKAIERLQAQIVEFYLRRKL